MNFEDALLAGLADDGGLYVPETWPHFTYDDISALRGKPYAEVVYQIIQPFIGASMPEKRLRSLIEDAYAAFAQPDIVAPLVRIDAQHYMLELFHGPTLAFKDIAMQLLARLMDDVLQKRNQRVTIIGATSGDTGSAAIEAFRGRAACDIFILYPHGRVSDVQRRQMTTIDEANVHVLAIDGNFDDCQALVKAMFNDAAFRTKHHLAGVNSINWARIMGQIAYYFTAALALNAPETKSAFCVPTGNFGDIFAGFIAKQMGLPIERLVIATNVNDILVRALKGGVYAIDELIATNSPSMDIQVSSNFERLLFEASQRDAAQIRALMTTLARDKAFPLGRDNLERIRHDFLAEAVNEAETAKTISYMYEHYKKVIDPHSAVGFAAARAVCQAGSIAPDIPVVTLGTAHPAKFPDAVKAACGVTPDTPAHIAAMAHAQEIFTRLPNDVARIKHHITEHVG